MSQTDTPVENRVLTALESDSRIGEEAIEVLNDSGVVTLKGTVDSMPEREAAEEIAGRQPGVVSVINDLEVKSDDQDSPAVRTPHTP
jgi:osmotically-inducible protein OsmY